MRPLTARAARAYVAGPALEDATRVAEELALAGLASTLGFWDGPDDPAPAIVREYATALDAIAAAGSDSYLSIKWPAMGGSAARLSDLLARARQSDVRIHFDSLAPDVADATWAAARAAARAGVIVSASVPGRWRRSLDDVEAAIDSGVLVRVVKGQWPDPSGADLDPRAGYLAIIDRLAGRIPFVAVATHDGPLAYESITRLQATGTCVELELLYGLPHRPALTVAAELGVPVRIYVPYGHPYLPYGLRQIVRRPQLLFALMRDVLTSSGGSRDLLAGKDLQRLPVMQAAPRR